MKHSGIKVDPLKNQVEDLLSGKSVEKIIKLYLPDKIDPYKFEISGAEAFDKFGIVPFGSPNRLFINKDLDLFIFNKVGDLLQDYNKDLRDKKFSGNFKKWLIKYCYGLALYYI